MVSVTVEVLHAPNPHAVRDDEGKTYIDTIELVQPAEIIATAIITDASCSANTSDGAVELEASGGAGNFIYLWSNGATSENLTNITAGNYSVNVSDENECQAQFDLLVSGINNATAYAGEDDMICAGSEYQLFGSLGDSVKWEPSAYMDNNKIPEPTVNIDSRTEFVLTVYDNGCWDSDTVVIDVFDDPELEIYDPSGSVIIDSTLFLLAGESFTLAATDGFDSYQWSPGTWLSNPVSREVIVSPEDNIKYHLVAISQNGCIKTDSVHVIIARPLEIYSGFSPNDDGINDTWVISHASEYGERIRVQVFNRWGEPVFETKGYGSSEEWDGTRNGKPLPIGVYYYIVELEGVHTNPFTGTVTIIR